MCYALPNVAWNYLWIRSRNIPSLGRPWFASYLTSSLCEAVLFCLSSTRVQRELSNIPEGAVQQTNGQMRTETTRSLPWDLLWAFLPWWGNCQGHPFPVLCCAASIVLISGLVLWPLPGVDITCHTVCQHAHSVSHRSMPSLARCWVTGSCKKGWHKKKRHVTVGLIVNKGKDVSQRHRTHRCVSCKLSVWLEVIEVPFEDKCLREIVNEIKSSKQLPGCWKLAAGSSSLAKQQQRELRAS